MQVTELIERAKKQMAGATGMRPEAVTGFRQDDGGWLVSVEFLEMSRIPPATDVLGEYDVLVGQEGELLQFQRKRTRLRGEPKGVDSG